VAGQARDAPAVVGPDELDAVAAALEDGRIVAIPTDTVYGLAARLDRPRGVSGLFTAKGRPPGLALPVLIGHRRQVHLVASDWPRLAAVLAARFWPGPLTLVVPAPDEIGALLGGDGRTAGLRLPDRQVVRSLCRRIGPLAVTSANRHGAPPCTTAADVSASFGSPGATGRSPGSTGRASPPAPGLVALVLDGGVCDAPPSTVVDCTASPPGCLREGGIPWSWVQAALR